MEKIVKLKGKSKNHQIVKKNVKLMGKIVKIKGKIVKLKIKIVKLKGKNVNKISRFFSALNGILRFLQN